MSNTGLPHEGAIGLRDAAERIYAWNQTCRYLGESLAPKALFPVQVLSGEPELDPRANFDCCFIQWSLWIW